MKILYAIQGTGNGHMIREAENKDKGHYTVYHPSCDNKSLVKVLAKIPEADWQVFSKHANTHVTIDHIDIHPVHNDKFLQSLTSCKGVLCGQDSKHLQKPYTLGRN